MRIWKANSIWFYIYLIYYIVFVIFICFWLFLLKIVHFHKWNINWISIGFRLPKPQYVAMEVLKWWTVSNRDVATQLLLKQSIPCGQYPDRFHKPHAVNGQKSSTRVHSMFIYIYIYLACIIWSNYVLHLSILGTCWPQFHCLEGPIVYIVISKG